MKSLSRIVWSSFFHHPSEKDEELSVFGEFATLSQQHTIRGCMGWWTQNFHPLSARELSAHFSSSLQEAMMMDSRSIPFHNTDFFADPTSRLHFQAMMLPIRRLDLTKEEGFDNATEGILLTQKRGDKRATFLPGVFPGSTARSILPPLLTKAGSPKMYDLYRYETQSVEWRAIDTLKKARPFLRSLARRIASSILSLIRRYPRTMPYVLPPGTAIWSCDDTQHVRNLSCLSLLESYFRRRLPETEAYRARIHVSDPHAMVYVHPEAVDPASLDDEFGKPQLLLMLGSRIEVTIPWSVIERSVFAWNWWTQVLVLYESAEDDYDRLVQIAESFPSLSETNEMAVVFEGCAALSRVRPSIQSRCIQCLQQLGDRRRQSDFYVFTDGSCRLDITCHVLRGLMYLSM